MRDVRPDGDVPAGRLGRTRYAFCKSWEESTALASVCLVTAAKGPLRVDAPSTGWVTALAGLLACGSLLTSGLPSFPVADVDAGSPLTVAGAATVSRAPMPQLRVPSFLPGFRRGTSTSGGFNAKGSGVKADLPKTMEAGARAGLLAATPDSCCLVLPRRGP